MKKQLYIFLLFILFSNLTILGQDEKAETKILVDSFIKAFNSDDYESVFSLFSDEMKKQLPLDKLNNFLQNLNSGAGKIHKNEFIKYEEKVAIYKLSFDNWTSQYSFSINKNQKIMDAPIELVDIYPTIIGHGGNGNARVCFGKKLCTTAQRLQGKGKNQCLNGTGRFQWNKPQSTGLLHQNGSLSLDTMGRERSHGSRII